MTRMSFSEWVHSGFTLVPNLLLQHFKQLGLSHDELVLVIQLKAFMDQGIEFPETAQLATQLHLTEEQVFALIHQLTHKKMLEIKVKTDEDNKTKDVYSLDFLWDKLAMIEKNEATHQEEQTEVVSQKNLIQLFEEEFSRPLSPIEIQTIGMWSEIDGYALPLIEFALREAVLSQVYSLKYIDRILLSWEKKNIRTRKQAEKESSLYRERKTTSSADSYSHTDPDDDPVPLHNWLNGSGSQ